MTRIFICHRREIRGDQILAGRFLDRLRREFEGPFILDVPPGTHFTDYCDKHIEPGDIMLVLIGNEWATFGAPGPLLSGENDFVRIQIAMALERAIFIVPVLLDGAPMPDSSAVPEGLRGLYARQAAQVTASDFERDVAALIASMQAASATPPAVSLERDWLPVPWPFRSMVYALIAVLAYVLYCSWETSGQHAAQGLAYLACAFLLADYSIRKRFKFPLEYLASLLLAYCGAGAAGEFFNTALGYMAGDARDPAPFAEQDQMAFWLPVVCIAILVLFTVKRARELA
jgi:hypothetical protein